MTGPEHNATPGAIDPTALRIESGHLVELTTECTCGGTDIGVGYQHEPGCGQEPLMTVAELATLVSAPKPVLTPSELDMLAHDFSAAISDNEYPLDVSQDDIRPHLPVFLAAVLGGAR